MRRHSHHSRAGEVGTSVSLQGEAHTASGPCAVRRVLSEAGRARLPAQGARALPTTEPPHQGGGPLRRRAPHAAGRRVHMPPPSHTQHQQKRLQRAQEFPTVGSGYWRLLTQILLNFYFSSRCETPRIILSGLLMSSCHFPFQKTGRGRTRADPGGSGGQSRPVPGLSRLRPWSLPGKRFDRRAKFSTCSRHVRGAPSPCYRRTLAPQGVTPSHTPALTAQVLHQ